MGANQSTLPALGPSRFDRHAAFKKKYVVTEPGCWLWTGAVQSRGYGCFGDGTGSSVLAHRWAYENIATSTHQPGPAPRELKQTCGNQLCVNPDHMTAAKKWQAYKTHCMHGHDLTPGTADEPNRNLIVRPNGRRRCRACDYERGKLYEARKRVRYDGRAPTTSVDPALIPKLEREQRLREAHAAYQRKRMAAARAG